MNIKNWYRGLSLNGRGLRYKLAVAFSIMSLLPLLISVYLATNYIFPQYKGIGNISIVIFLGIVLALLGFVLIKQMVESVIKVATEAKIIAKGDVGHRIDLRRQDEIGDIGTALNQLTSKIKDNMTELRSYGERTKEINVEIHKKVLILSSLLQIGRLISDGTAELTEILHLAVENCVQIEEGLSVYLLLLDEQTQQFQVKAWASPKDEEAISLAISTGEEPALTLLETPDTLVADSQKRPPAVLRSKEFFDCLGLINVISIPITSRGSTRGILILGNDTSGFTFKQDTVESAKIFARQIAIAIENDLLIRTAKQLQIKDELTGLYNQKYITDQLAEEIKRAIMHQRPCSFILYNINDFRKFRDIQGDLVAESTLRKIGSILKENVTDIDKVSRFGPNEFAILLVERNKKEAEEIAREIQDKVQAHPFAEDETRGPSHLTVSLGVSENPIDGSTAEELIEKAGEALRLDRSNEATT